jgi:ubiquinone/menaquinone biosynthesis C-methylase UbiE
MLVWAFQGGCTVTDIMNYFGYPTAAERYANARPFFHPLAIKKIRAICCKNGRINRALDVGCGTGQSTLALLEVADEIVGVDNSAPMLSQAIRHAQVRYCRARAEHMPFGDASFGFITVALSFHWFDQRQFMLEARRVLRPGGWLVIYNDWFSGQMTGNDNYEKWYREHYLVRYQTPPRNNQSLTESDALAYGFEPSGFDQFVHEVDFTLGQLVDYMLTQTNVVSAVEAGGEDLQSVANWLLNSIQPLFAGTANSFSFSCQLRFFKRG